MLCWTSWIILLVSQLCSAYKSSSFIKTCLLNPITVPPNSILSLNSYCFEAKFRTWHLSLLYFILLDSAHQSSLSRAIWILSMFLQSAQAFFFLINHKFGKQDFYVFYKVINKNVVQIEVEARTLCLAIGDLLPGLVSTHGGLASYKFPSLKQHPADILLYNLFLSL